MAANQDKIDALRKLLSDDPSILEGAAGSGDIKQASAALARHAESNGIALDADEIEQAFQRREGSGQSVEELDDSALEKVAGGGSPWCWWTSGCYCFFTK